MAGGEKPPPAKGDEELKVFRIIIPILLALQVLVVLAIPVSGGASDNVSEETTIETGASGNIDVSIEVKGPAKVYAAIDGPANAMIKTTPEVELTVHAGSNSNVTINGESYKETDYSSDQHSGSSVALTLEEQQPGLAKSEVSNEPDKMIIILSVLVITGLISFFISGYYAKKHRADRSE